ncbi:hypothetical protein BV20DRAFT_104158 [Pilatotrama ljubarskyi]|nr:hypothetical protein BV20DRAFT_104158 [Pilatotrama ljubarskyi]
MIHPFKTPAARPFVSTRRYRSTRWDSRIMSHLRQCRCTSQDTGVHVSSWLSCHARLRVNVSGQRSQPSALLVQICVPQQSKLCASILYARPTRIYVSTSRFSATLLSLSTHRFSTFLSSLLSSRSYHSRAALLRRQTAEPHAARLKLKLVSAFAPHPHL